MKNSIYNTLECLQLTSKKTRKIFNTGTRDVNDLVVWKDGISGVIYIDDFYTGDSTYHKGFYRKEQIKTTGSHDFEELSDAQRRLNSSLPFISGKRVLDFGCGKGIFLQLANRHCESVCGIELQENYIKALNKDGISCLKNLDNIKNNSIDTCVSFHVIEHLPNPLEILSSLKKKIVKGGTIIIEVPHANDFLLSCLKSNDFKRFTLWSQHLILHTRESLRRMLEHIGLIDIQIEGVQRYPLSNHLGWLSNGKPGGHKGTLSAIDSSSMHQIYSSTLSDSK